MEQTVTTIEELMRHVHTGMTAKELGAAVIALVPVKLKFKLACEARDRLGRKWTDGTVRAWLAPRYHSEKRADQQREWSRCSMAARYAEPQNGERHRENQRRWYAENLEQAREASRRWQVENREHRRGYYSDRRANDPVFRLVRNLRSRVWDAMSGRSKAARTLELVGCSIEELRAHLEQQFTDGMGWHNYGEWHVDHIRPCASFDLTDPEQQRACFHWSNLQPLWAEDNLAKGSLYDGVRHGAQVEATRSGV